MIGTPWDKDAALAALIRFGQLHGRAPTCAEFKKPVINNIPHTRTCARLFGGEVAAIQAAGLPPRKRYVTPLEERKRPRRKKDPHLRDLAHEWYRSDRVVQFVYKHYPPAGIYTLLADQSPASCRRWTSMLNGEQEYVSLPVVDKMLTHLDLHIWVLGEPDLICKTAPIPGKHFQLELEEAA
jgi:hypothetical protein